MKVSVVKGFTFLVAFPDKIVKKGRCRNPSFALRQAQDDSVIVTVSLSNRQGKRLNNSAF
jgi:hypothetical protein